MTNHRPQPDDDAQAILIQQVQEFRRRLEADDVQVAIDPTLPVAEQLAQLQEAVLNGLARCRMQSQANKQTEEALRESQERLRTILDTLPVGVLITDTSGHVIESNDVVKQIYAGTGVLTQSPQEYRRGKAWWADSGQPIHDGEWPSDDALRTGKAELNLEIDILRADGTRGTMLDSAAPLRDAEGRITGAVVVIQDITERKRDEEALRESEQRYRELFETMQESLFVVEIIPDAHGQPVDWRYVEANPQLAHYMQMTREQLVGHRYSEVVPQPDPTWIQVLGKVALTGEPVTQEIYAPTRGRWLHINAYSPRPGQAAVLFTDITEQRETRQALEQLTATLEQRVRERTAALEAANKELEAFSYSVSHDMRAPLRSIEGFSRILLDKYAAQIDPTGQDYLARVRNAALRMGRLIDDMLKLSRIGRAEMHRESVNLSDLAAGIINDLRQREPERRVKVEIEPGLQVSGDPSLLGIMLENLLGNAWKFTGKTPEACIEVGAMLQDGQRVYYVRDNGAGFDMSYADKLFTPFQRLHTEEEFPGTGIGLAIVQRIITRHGGRVWAEGVEGKGATVYFTLGEEH